MGQSHWWKGLAEAVFPPPAKEVQPATGAAETVLLCHHRVCPVFIYNCLVWFSYQNRHQKTTTDSHSGLLKGLSVPLCPASKNFTSQEQGKGLIKSLWTAHTQLTLFELFATEHWAPKQPDTRTVFTPRPYPTWTTHNTPQYCISGNNLSNPHPYIGHMHIHSSVYGHFSVLYIFLFYYYCYS